MERNTSPVLVISALIVGVVALTIAWGAYNRAGTDLEDQSREEAKEALSQTSRDAQAIATATERTAKLLDARADLLAIRARVEANEEYSEVVSEVSELENRLRAEYEVADTAARQEWAEIQESFDRLEIGLRSETADVLELFAGLTLLLENEIRVDEKPD